MTIHNQILALGHLEDALAIEDKDFTFSPDGPFVNVYDVENKLVLKAYIGKDGSIGRMLMDILVEMECEGLI